MSGLAPAQHTNGQPTLSERADALEEHMMHELEHIVTRSVLFGMADGKVEMESGPALIDYFRCRFASTSHLLQSATHALKGGHSEKVVLACLLHDIAVVSFIRCDHGYWGAQMIEPYVDEQVSWAIRAHQALRFFPNESV